MTEVLPLYARLPTAEQQKIFARRIAGAESCCPPTSPKLTDGAGYPLRCRSGQRADIHTAGVPRCNGNPIEPISQGPRPRKRPAGPAGRHRACVSGCTHHRPTPNPGPASRIRRSCAPTWRRSSCRWRRSASARHRAVPFPGPAGQPQHSRRHPSCCRNSAHSTVPAL